MSTQQVVDRILSDGRKEAQTIVKEAEAKAAKLLADASARSQDRRRETEEQTRLKAASIFDKKASAARLESGKIELAEKRKVLDYVYEVAQKELATLSKEDCLQLYDALLKTYAETDDELFFADGFAYAKEVSSLPVIKQKGIVVSEKTMPFGGGIRLVGKTSDKDLSYAALLAADREKYQAELAAELFGK